MESKGGVDHKPRSEVSTCCWAPAKFRTERTPDSLEAASFTSVFATPKNSFFDATMHGLTEG